MVTSLEAVSLVLKKYKLPDSNRTLNQKIYFETESNFVKTGMARSQHNVIKFEIQKWF